MLKPKAYFENAINHSKTTGPVHELPSPARFHWLPHNYSLLSLSRSSISHRHTEVTLIITGKQQIIFFWLSKAFITISIFIIIFFPNIYISWKVIWSYYCDCWRETNQVQLKFKLRKLRGNAFNPLLPKGFPIDE